MWFRRTILTTLLVGFSLIVSFQFAELAIPSLNLENALLIAAAVMIVFAIVMRLMVLAVLGGLILSLLMLVTIVVASQFFFLEQEQDRWYANQNELPQTVEHAKKRKLYMQSLGLEGSDNPIMDSLFHSRHQADSALSSQQLSKQQVAAPVPKVSADEVWQQWLYQLLALVGGAFMSIFIGCTKKAK